MDNCKGCGSVNLTKNDKNKLGAQRYRCKECGGTFVAGDGRLKHGLEKRLKVIKIYGTDNKII
ncbi:MAG: hypothetical protein EKK61_01265 [Rickettsiales bacterium]|nr:MAG: hypothetical protein EKK61_01265 [Rickettsiales bacterium]